TIPTNNLSTYPNKDTLVAGLDLLYGDGPGSAAGILGADDDIVFGDHGAITQDVAGPRDTTRPPSTQLQKLQTTTIASLHLFDPAKPSLLTIESKALQTGADDILYGNLDRDVLVGGPGNDQIDGGQQDDLVFGDDAALKRTADTNSPHFQALTGTLLYS